MTSKLGYTQPPEPLMTGAAPRRLSKLGYTQLAEPLVAGAARQRRRLHPLTSPLQKRLCVRLKPLRKPLWVTNARPERLFQRR